MDCVLQKWVMELPLKMQATLISAVRSCDGEISGSHKLLTKAVRVKVLVKAHPVPKSFLNAPGPKGTMDAAEDFMNHHDHLPIHFVTHLMQAIEVIGYYHPDIGKRMPFMRIYKVWCKRIHVTPETKKALEKRLG